jgi:hypothetical protein
LFFFEEFDPSKEKSWVWSCHHLLNFSTFRFKSSPLFLFLVLKNITHPFDFAPLPLFEFLFFSGLSLSEVPELEAASGGFLWFSFIMLAILETSSTLVSAALLFSSWILKYISSLWMVTFWGAIIPSRTCRPRTPKMVIFISSPMVTLSPNFLVKISIAPSFKTEISDNQESAPLLKNRPIFEVQKFS